MAIANYIVQELPALGFHVHKQLCVRLFFLFVYLFVSFVVLWIAMAEKWVPLEERMSLSLNFSTFSEMLEDTSKHLNICACVLKALSMLVLETTSF